MDSTIHHQFAGFRFLSEGDSTILSFFNHWFVLREGDAWLVRVWRAGVSGIGWKMRAHWDAV